MRRARTSTRFGALGWRVVGLAAVVSLAAFTGTADVPGVRSLAWAQATAGAKLEILAVKRGKPDLTLPFTSGKDAGPEGKWASGKPAFEIANPGSELGARGWLGLSREALLVRIEVTDDKNTNAGSRDGIWIGDMVRVSIDGLGDGARGGPADLAGPFGADDKSFGFALTDGGPVGWAFGAGPLEDFSVSRDEGKRLTHYRAAIPWRAMEVTPGALPTFGIAVTVRDADEARARDAPLIHWGSGAGGLAAGGFKAVAFAERLAPGSPQVYGVHNAKTTLWAPGDALEAWAYSSEPGATIWVEGGGGKHAQVIKSQAEAGWFIVRVTPMALPADDVVVGVNDKAGAEKVRWPLQAARPLRDFEAVVARLDALIARPQHPLFTRHLQSIKALVLDEWGRLQLYRAWDRKRAEATARHLQTILAGLQGDATEWKTYLDGRRSLIIAFISKKDKTLQQYVLTLPKDWDPAQPLDKQKPQAFFVELHGSGDDHRLGNAAALVAAGGGAFAGLGYDERRPYARQARKGVHIEPFGRGNLGYRGISETDVWEAYEDAQTWFRPDPERQYLYGFSMGGSGTWALGTRTPDRWAALGILGASPRPPEWKVEQNLTGLPVFLWSGEHDEFAAGGYKELVAALKAAGIALTTRQEPNLGHNYRQEVQEEVYEWLWKHKRRRPEKFSFVADTEDHTGIWGIEMERALHISGAPRFSAEVKGSRVVIESQGTPRLSVDLGPEGLDLRGQVTVVWNGQTVYSGTVDKAPKPLRLSASGQRN